METSHRLPRVIYPLSKPCIELYVPVLFFCKMLTANKVINHSNNADMPLKGWA